MKTREVDVLNLTLTSDGRLVEAGKEKMNLYKMRQMTEKDKSVLVMRDASEIEKKALEDLTDDLIMKCIEGYTENAGRYIKISEFNRDKNIVVLRFTLGVDLYVLLRYEKNFYGSRKSTLGKGYYPNEMLFDIGVKIVGIANGNISMKLDDTDIIRLSSVESEYANNTMKYVKADYRLRDNTTVSWSQQFKNTVEPKFGQRLMEYINMALNKVCETNKELVNNT